VTTMRKLLLLTLLFASCMPQHPVVSMTSDSTAALAGGKLFRQHCSGCHGSEGAGSRYAPALQSARVQSMDPHSLFRFITDGNLRHGMPSWSRLPDERRWQIVAYVKSLTTANAAQGSPRAQKNRSDRSSSER